MAENNYYFLAAALPELEIGYPPDISFNVLDALMRLNLSEKDYQKVIVIRRFYDLQNIRSFWKGEKLDPRGNFDENELEEALITRIGFPEYVYEFMDKYEQREERVRRFPALLAAYYNWEKEANKGFLRDYLSFEREWRLVLTTFRAKKLGQDIAVELQDEDPYEELVAQILAQKDSKGYEPPSRYEELKGIFEQHREAPLELHQALCEYRFQKIEEMYGVEVFSISRILAYFVQLMIVVEWLELDKKKGLEVVDTLLKEAL